MRYPNYSNIRSDTRGQDKCDWMADKEAVILNDGSATRMDHTGLKSAPDLSIVHASLGEDCKWRTETRLNSDHLPCVTTLRILHTAKQEERRLVWNWRAADWDAFGRAVANNLKQTGKDIKTETANLTQAILQAGHECVGMKAVGDRRRIWMTPELRAEIDRRDSLRGQLPGSQTEWQEQTEKVQEEMKSVKREIWRHKVDEQQTNGTLWGLLRNLKAGATPSNEAKGEILHFDNRSHSTDKQKANAFKACYSRVCNFRIRKEDRALKRKLNQSLREPTDAPSTSPTPIRRLVRTRSTPSS
jgi:hypothetical protein